MNFIQIGGLSINPKKVRNLISHNLARTQCPVISVNFYPPLADIVFLFKSKKERDDKFDDIRKRQELQ